jgi:chemotaxis protein CheX
MDETVHEVFGVMLGIDVATAVPGLSADNKSYRRREQTALICFAGALSGVCEISLSTPASVAVTSAMLGGTDVPEESEWICDAVGELCNLLAGGWKNRLPAIGAECSLSQPTVIVGGEYQVHHPANLVVRRLSYSFGEEHLLQLTLVCDPSG